MFHAFPPVTLASDCSVFSGAFYRNARLFRVFGACFFPFFSHQENFAFS